MSCVQRSGSVTIPKKWRLSIHIIYREIKYSIK